MTQKGFEEYIYAVYGNKTGTAKSYITAIHIIDQMFVHEDVFGLHGQSITTLTDEVLLKQIVDFVISQQTLFIKEEESIFKYTDRSQISYPGKRFCSAAIKQLMAYQQYDKREKLAEPIWKGVTSGKLVSKSLIAHFDINKEGKDSRAQAKIRLGQSYFRKMVLDNYNNQCCITGLNVPQILRASHIVAWAEDKGNRMNPENGLCLSATYDAAFDKYLISFDEDYRMIISKDIKEYYTNDAVNEYFGKYEGKKLILPKSFLPSPKLLEKHRELMIY